MALGSKPAMLEPGENMIRKFILTSLVLALFAGGAMAQTAENNDVDAEAVAAARAAMREIVGFVEAALTQPLADLKKSARKGLIRDKLIYGLALKAGRMGPKGVKTGDKFIKRVRQEYESGGTTAQFGSASRVSPLETTPLFGYSLSNRHSGTATVIRPDVVTTKAVIDSLWVDIATQCVDALGAAKGEWVDMSVCGGETEYYRLRALMPKS